MAKFSRRAFFKAGGEAIAGLATVGSAFELATRVATPAPALAAGRKDVLTIALPSNPETLDPNRTRAVLTGSITRLVHETLVTRAADTMKLAPGLAVRWQNVNPTTWEFKLRQGVTFHNGENFNAQSVKFSLERALGPKLNSGAKAYLTSDHFEHIEPVDAYTVRLHTKRPDPLLPARLAAEPVGMQPPKAYGGFLETYVTDKPVGTGPYRFVEYVLGDHLTLEANPSYWGQKAATKRVVWKVIPDAQTRVAALQRGEVDVVVNLPVPLVPIVERDADLTIYSALGSTTHALLINTLGGGPLADRRVRQALNYAVDKEAILKNLYGGRGKVLSTVAAQQIEGAIDAGVYHYDPSKAKQLLAEAGYANGFETTLQQATGRWPLAVEAAQAIVDYLDKVGVKAKLETVEWGEYNRIGATNKAKALFYYAFTNLLWDATKNTVYFRPEYGRYVFYHVQGDLRQAVESLDREFDTAKRREIEAKLLKAVRDEAVWVYLYQLDEIFALRKAVKGFKMRGDQHMIVEQAYAEQ